MNSHMNFIKEQLYTLTSIPSPSSFTAKVTDYLLSELSSLGYSPERSNKGNVFVTLGGSGSPLILAAHVDTLGAMVRSIKENGRLRPHHSHCGATGSCQFPVFCTGAEIHRLPIISLLCGQCADHRKEKESSDRDPA